MPEPTRPTPRAPRARWRITLATAALCLGALGPAARAAGPAWAIDVPGGQDHPLLQRYADSWLYAYQQQGFDSTTFPGQLGLDARNAFRAPVVVEGRITRLLYFAPLGRTPLEVQRNYEQALQAAGFKTVVSCTPRVPRCDNMRYGFDDHYAAMKEADHRASSARHPEGSALQKNIHQANGGSNMLGSDDVHFSYGTLTRQGSTVHVMLNTGKVYRTDFTATYIEIAEPKAMDGGLVSVNAEALGAGLKNEGHIALHGVFFDTGKAELRPESRAQLDEIGRLLKAQPALKPCLVGHTDNQGGLEANLLLSQQRAQAVVDALARGQGIDARRLCARGVASLAPVASNATDEGRARNRRVELVLP